LVQILPKAPNVAHM